MNFGAIATSVLGGLISAYSANQAADSMSGTMDKVKGELSDWRNAIDDYQKTSQDYMSIGSQMNQNLRSNIRDNALDFVAMGNRINQRNLSSGGVGGYSGIAGQNADTTLQKALNQSEIAFQQAFLNNQKFGTSLMDSYTKNLRAYGENMAQGHIQNDAMKANLWQSGLGGFGEGLMQSGMESLYG
tara:strand:- start:3605 stop:4162 length:558 start_codon:yes stop_codon:yes gene_type:complete